MIPFGNHVRKRPDLYAYELWIDTGFKCELAITFASALINDFFRKLTKDEDKEFFQDRPDRVVRFLWNMRRSYDVQVNSGRRVPDPYGIYESYD